jgi:WD40 repeat protein
MYFLQDPLLLYRLQGDKATISGDGHRIVTCLYGDIMVWDAATGQSTLTFQAHTWTTCQHISKDGKWLVTGCDNGKVKLWSLLDGEHLKKLRGLSSQAGPICRVAKVKTFKGHGHAYDIHAVELSPDGEKVASVCRSYGKMIIWSTNTGKQLWACYDHDMHSSTCNV